MLMHSLDWDSLLVKALSERSEVQSEEAAVDGNIKL
jgi:hypothetical protein